MVDALTSDHEARPGEPHRYRFHLTNTTDRSLEVVPTAVNSLAGWSGVLLDDDGSRLGGAMHIGPRQSATVIVEVTVPFDARVGDRNTVSLEVTLADDSPAPKGAQETRTDIAARDPKDLEAVGDEFSAGIQ